MNNKVAFILGTIIGAGIGVAGTYSYFKASSVASTA